MNKTKTNFRPTVSIVIPVYNEETYLAACLDAIAAQTVQPLEVIVVDNNSTDGSAAIARQYAFARVIHESRQGVVHARDSGFNAARGEIIGRIDADTLLLPDWVEKVQQHFSHEAVAALSGASTFYDVAYGRILDQGWLLARRYLAKYFVRRDEQFLYGANMALRRSLWRKVREDLCTDPRLHEDLDLAAHLAHQQVNIIYDETLVVGISARRIESGPFAYYQYVTANARTYTAHKLRSHRYMYLPQIGMLLVYLPLKVLYKGYDKETGKFSVRQLLRPVYSKRISPISETTSP